MADTDTDRLEALMHAGMDAESALRNDVETDSDNEEAVKLQDEVIDHLSNLSCSETMKDALANTRAAIKAIDAASYSIRRAYSWVRRSLIDGLTEIGESAS